MQFLANENMPMSVILHLRAAGHDVLAAKESMRGETDNAILARAQSELRNRTPPPLSPWSSH
jgi:hypothetical protein